VTAGRLSEPPPPVSRGPFRRTGYVLGVTAFGAGIPTPLYAVYEARYGFGAGVLGLVFGAYTIGVVVTMLFVAPMSDAIGRKPILYIGMGLTAASGVAFILANGAAGLALARVVSGLAVGATTSTATAAMARLEPNLDQHHVARVSVASNFGGVAAGILLSGILVAYLPDPTVLVFLVLIGTSLLGMVAVAATPETAELAGVRIRRLKVPSEIRTPFLIAALALAACYAIYGFFGALAPTFVRIGLGLGGSIPSAIVVATMFGSAAVVQLALAQLRDRRALLLGFPLLVVGLAVLALALVTASLSIVVAAAALLGVAVGCAYMGSVTLIDRVAPDLSRGEILSSFYLVGYLALAVPTIGVAFASEPFGLGTAAAAFGITLGLFAVVGGVATARTRTPPGGEGRPRTAS
jgi:predicted MFS family arabinose efflux permease